MTTHVLIGDAREQLKGVPSGSVQCCVTSPPFWGLRDYGTATWDGGDPACDHKPGSVSRVGGSTLGSSSQTSGHQQEGYKGSCGRCGAIRVDQQIGMEATPQDYVAALVEVFTEVWRVLRDDGTLWVELGDCYCSIGHKKSHSGYGTTGLAGGIAQEHHPLRRENSVPGLAHKSLIGIPWRVAFALQDAGWILRSEIIWARPNPMPESVRDRCTRSHSTIFMFSKRARYYYDADAIAERALAENEHDATGTGAQVPGQTPQTGNRPGRVHAVGKNSRMDHDRDPRHAGAKQRAVAEGAYPGFNERYTPGTFYTQRNKRSVWTVATKPYRGAHFATFPPALIEPMILASTSAHGACCACGAPWARSTEIGYLNPGNRTTNGPRSRENLQERRGFATRLEKQAKTLGWHPTCSCGGDAVRPCVVLDPFAGSGTTLMVATQHGRDALGVELNPAYRALQEERLAGLQLSMASAL